MTLDELKNAFIGIRSRFQQNGGNNQQVLQEISNYIRQNQIDPNLAAQAASAVSGTPWDVNRVQQTLAQYQGTQQGPAQYGLQPAMNTLMLAGEDATNRIDKTQDAVTSLFQRGQGYLNPYIKTGGQAFDLQAAQSGALGAEAQRKAYADYNQGPGVQFAQQEAEKALLRNRAAIGGLGGGDTKSELARMAAGTFAQDFGNQYDRLSGLSQMGYGASTTGAGLAGQEAGYRSQLGQFSANIPLQQSALQSNMQFQAGRDLSQNIGNVTTGLAAFQNQQGAGQAQLVGDQANNLNQLYQLANQGDAQARAQLASLLQNTNMNGAASFNGAPGSQVAPTNYLNTVGQLAGGFSGLLQGMSQNQTPQAQNINNPNFGNRYVPNYGSYNNAATGYGPNYSTPYNQGVPRY